MSINQHSMTPGTMLVSTSPREARHANNPQGAYIRVIQRLPAQILEVRSRRGTVSIDGFFVLPLEFRDEHSAAALELAAIGLFAERMLPPSSDGRRHGPNASSWSIFPGELKTSIDFVLQETSAN